ncbi:MAG: hypothetical protein LCH30_01295 [Proteobacteria bacterium]|nr:hypothetical protein [Pseudomonadota bacterium]
MNKDIFQYKKRGTLFILLFSFTYLYTKLTAQVTNLPFEGLIHFSVPLPYNQRVLVPLTARLITYLSPLQLNHIFFLIALIFFCLTYLCLVKLMQMAYSKKQAQLLAALFILLLPLCLVINYRYSWGGEAAVFHPYDAATFFFMTLGFYLCLKQKWLYFFINLFFATLNRESSFLLILLIPCLNYKEMKGNYRLLFFAIFLYALTRYLIFYCLPNHDGSFIEFNMQQGEQSHFAMNMQWLFLKENIFLCSFSFLFLPLIWFCLCDYIPPQYRPIRYISLFYFLLLIFVGNITEARIFIEIIVLLYFPACLAISNWLNGNYYQFKPSLCTFIDRYAIIFVLSLFFVLAAFLF